MGVNPKLGIPMIFKAVCLVSGRVLDLEAGYANTVNPLPSRFSLVPDKRLGENTVIYQAVGILDKNDETIFFADLVADKHGSLWSVMLNSECTPILRSTDDALTPIHNINITWAREMRIVGNIHMPTKEVRANV